MYNTKALNENLHVGVIMYIQDCYCYNYDTKKASGKNGINRYNIGKSLNKTKVL